MSVLADALQPALPFAATVAPIIMTPGAGFAVFASTIATRGLRQATTLVAGMLGGMCVVAAFVALAYPWLASRHAAVRPAIALAGGVYLTWMGVRSLARLAHAARAAAGTAPAVVADGGGARQRLTEGALTSLTNPGIYVINLVVIPAFIPPGLLAQGRFTLLAVEHITMTAIWYSALLWAFALARRLPVNPRLRLALTVASSVALVITGVRSALPVLRG